MKKKGASHRGRKEHRRTIAALKEENRILRCELKRLNQVFMTHFSDSTRERSAGSEKLFLLEQKSTLALTSSSYVKYLAARLSRASFYSFVKKISGGFRKFKLISTVMRVISSAIAFIGTGAVFIFISGVAIFFFPFVLLVSLIVYLTSMMFRKKAFKNLDAKLKDKNIFVFFPQSGRPFENRSCFSKTLQKISKIDQNNNFIIVVSPFFTSPSGFGGSGYYSTLRFECENICIIRKHAFFAMRRKLLGKYSGRTTYVY